ncbi:MAG TPA: molecular chaperone DnaJ [Hyphomonadaceae bacterium]|nr:molecular chaperone DnaJ [Hyphomonadaceae bacterium]
MLPALALIALAFTFLLFVRVSGARRAMLTQRWPSLALGALGLFALSRGALGPALTLAVLAGLSWFVFPALLGRPRESPPAEDAQDAEARRILGVGADASEAEIRAAYRRKIARAHPDRGGAHNAAARLTAARDHLLKRKR